MSKKQQLQRIIHHYKQTTGAKEIDMNDVASFALKKLGYVMAPAPTPAERLAKELAEAAREETRIDTQTGRAYRVNHAIRYTQGDRQLSFWVDIDEAPRSHIQKSLIQRREQMVGDAVQLTFDAEHWNRVNPNEAPIKIPLDFEADVDERKHAPDDKKTG